MMNKSRESLKNQRKQICDYVTNNQKVNEQRCKRLYKLQQDFHKIDLYDAECAYGNGKT